MVISKNPIKEANFRLTEKGIPFSVIKKKKNIGELRKLDKDFNKLIKGGK